MTRMGHEAQPRDAPLTVDERRARLPGGGLHRPEPAWCVASAGAAGEADAALDRLRLYLRLAHHWHWLNDGQYAHVSAQVAEIGRLLGGWIKQAAR